MVYDRIYALGHGRTWLCQMSSVWENYQTYRKLKDSRTCCVLVLWHLLPYGHRKNCCKKLKIQSPNCTATLVLHFKRQQEYWYLKNIKLLTANIFYLTNQKLQHMWKKKKSTSWLKVSSLPKSKCIYSCVVYEIQCIYCRCWGLGSYQPFKQHTTQLFVLLGPLVVAQY